MPMLTHVLTHVLVIGRQRDVSLYLQTLAFDDLKKMVSWSTLGECPVHKNQRVCCTGVVQCRLSASLLSQFFQKQLNPTFGSNMHVRRRIRRDARLNMFSAAGSRMRV
jgi:hypothetical protein